MTDRRRHDYLDDVSAQTVLTMCAHAQAALDLRDAANTLPARIQRTIDLCIDLRPTGRAAAARKKAQ